MPSRRAKEWPLRSLSARVAATTRVVFCTEKRRIEEKKQKKKKKKKLTKNLLYGERKNFAISQGMKTEYVFLGLNIDCIWLLWVDIIIYIIFYTRNVRLILIMIVKKNNLNICSNN